MMNYALKTFCIFGDRFLLKRNTVKHRTLMTSFFLYYINLYNVPNY